MKKIVFGISPWNNEIWARRGDDIIVATNDGTFRKGTIASFVSFISRVVWGVTFTNAGQHLKETIERMFENTEGGK